MTDIVERRCNTDLDMCLGGELRAEIERLRAAVTAERERCALKAYREIIAAVDDVRLANTIRDAIREGEL